MNATNLEKLAKAFNEKWPKEKVRVNKTLLHFSAQCFCYAPALEDIENAEFIVWTLDRLAELKGASYVSGEPLDFAAGDFHPSEGHYGCLAFAPTRAEALANALMKVLAVEEPVREES